TSTSTPSAPPSTARRATSSPSTTASPPGTCSPTTPSSRAPSSPRRRPACSRSSRWPRASPTA
ncbi:hypothetical protein GE543_27600, partial [Pseudomonas sp. SZ57]|nr:hypothetical protein [Pseudomonas sp. SZ57]